MCWASIDYSSCEIVDGEVTITTNDILPVETVMQVYLDSAFDLIEAGATDSGFKIKVMYQTLILIDDSDPGKDFTIGVAVSNAISVGKISVDKLNAAESAVYSFEFTSAADVTVGDYFVIKFPRNYDPHLGEAINSLAECEPDSFYIPCSSDALGDLQCTIDHWYFVTAGSGKAQVAGTNIDITISNIKNPNAGQVGIFKIWHFSKTDSLKAYQYLTSTLSPTITGISSSILTLKSVETTNNNLGETGTLAFDFYVQSSTEINDEVLFYFRFPSQYNLELLVSSSVSCSSVYYDESGAENVNRADEINWTDGLTSCDVYHNGVLLEIPQNTSSFTFTNTMKIRLSLTAFPSPQFGAIRDSDDDWDTIYSNEFGDFDSWTERFEISLTNIANKNIMSKTYGVLHSGYLGLEESAKPVDLGGYNPATGSGRVKLQPGTQSKDITINFGSWLKAKTIILTPSTNSNIPDNGGLKYTSAWYD